MNCFYCGRPLKEITSNDQNKTGIPGTAYKLACKYPRCKLKPESDWEPLRELCENDIEMIKRSI